jgi:NitT/TauT family transport system permease protein
MTDVLSARNALAPAPTGLPARLMAGKVLPVAIVLLVICALWYVAAIFMNADLQRESFSNAGTESYSTTDLVLGTWTQDRPKLPAPHQIAQELVKTVLETPVTSKRSLVYHAWVTVQATLAGFAIGSLFGILLSLLVTHMRSLDRGVMPWIIASQTVPVVALAPMIVVILNQFSVTGLLPKALIAAYLSFFPVTVGMVKGLRSPEVLHLDLMRTYSASAAQILAKLRLPASRPFLFASLKVGVAASLVGTIVAEVTKSEDGGIGARLLAGSYYGQTLQIWAALIMAAVCGAVLVGLVGLSERLLAPGRGFRA